jgi:hypothetical protein
LSKASWLALPALALLVSRAAGDATARDLPCPSYPALAAAPLIYAVVPTPSGERTWAEHQVEALRTRVRDRSREDLEAPAARVVLAPYEPLDRTQEPEQVEQHAPATADDRLLTAFEAIGLSPEDLLEKPEVPVAALTAAEAILDAIDWGLDGATRLRAMLRESAPIRIEEPAKNPKPDYVRFQPSGAVETVVPLMFVKRVVRSVYKILLGVAIGILIWGMVRRGGGGAGEPGTFFR